ncbi:dihydroorotase [Metabacillus indicus]|uniref:dihydroorotase n=1 Tax=Metabacillus indicus TaxID=246786 RepID=UPI003CEB15BD
MQSIIKNGFILTDSGEKVKADILITGGIISEISENIEADAAEVIDADGKLVSPGFVDLHIHLREPGGEHKETIETGTMAAAAGGFTAVAAMPNTKPVPDHAEQMNWLQDRIEEKAAVRVLPYASITVRQAGKELTDFEKLKEAGAFAFTDDGVGVQSAGMMYEAMKKAAETGASIVAHCEDNSLIYKGALHDGEFAKKHGINGIPSICESVQIARDVLLAEAAGCHYHVCHISTKESVRVVRDAKKAGINVTAEVTPHHLLLCDTDIPGLDTNYKMNPPLRGKEDREALIEGLLDGTIDFIATDHAPHTAEEKAEPLSLAPFGIVGLETAFPLLYTRFVESGEWTLKQLINFLTAKPAETFGLPFGRLEEGRAADLTILDLEEEKIINPETFLSKGKNTPFAGYSCKGWPEATIVEGEIVWKRERVNV